MNILQQPTFGHYSAKIFTVRIFANQQIHFLVKVFYGVKGTFLVSEHCTLNSEHRQTSLTCLMILSSGDDTMESQSSVGDSASSQTVSTSSEASTRLFPIFYKGPATNNTGNRALNEPSRNIHSAFLKSAASGLLFKTCI